MVAFPTELYKIKEGSYKESPPNNTIRTNMDVGPVKSRRRTTSNVRPISFTLVLNSDQLDTLDSFYDSDTFSGSDDFDFNLPRGGAAVRARFTQPPEYTDSIKNQLYEVSVSLEILPG